MAMMAAGLDVVAQDRRNDRGHDQDDDDEVVELLEEFVPEGQARCLGQLVRAELLQTAGGLVRRQAELRGGGESTKMSSALRACQMSASAEEACISRLSNKRSFFV